MACATKYSPKTVNYGQLFYVGHCFGRDQMTISMFYFRTNFSNILGIIFIGIVDLKTIIAFFLYLFLTAREQQLTDRYFVARTKQKKSRFIEEVKKHE